MSRKSVEDPFAWLEVLLARGDFDAADCLVARTPPDFERVYSLLLLAKAYFEQENLKMADARSAQAVTLWRVSRNEWWFLIVFGELLQGLVECGQSVLAKELIQEGLLLVENEKDAWFETHGWCGLALGSVSLGCISDSDMFFTQAVKVAESRPTLKDQASARSIVDIALAAVGSHR